MFPGRDDLVTHIHEPLLLDIRRMTDGMLSQISSCIGARVLSVEF